MCWKIGLKISLALLALGVLYLCTASLYGFYSACTADDTRGGLDIPLMGGPPCTFSGLLVSFAYLFLLLLMAFWWQILLAFFAPIVIGAWIDLYKQKF